MRHQQIVRQLIREEARDIRKFDELKGSYSFQGHMSNENEIELENISSFDPTEVNDVINKPEGFWTSTIYKDAEAFKTKWTEFEYSDADYFHAYTIVGSPNILHLGGKREADELFIGGERIVDIWRDIFEEYDAVHVYRGALGHRKFRAWDIESTVWFQPKTYLKEQFVWKV